MLEAIIGDLVVSRFVKNNFIPFMAEAYYGYDRELTPMAKAILKPIIG